MHLAAFPPNEGARRLAWWIGTQSDGIGWAFSRLAVAAGSETLVERLLAGEILPSEKLAEEVTLLTGSLVRLRDWRDAPVGGWADEPMFRFRTPVLQRAQAKLMRASDLPSPSPAGARR